MEGPTSFACWLVEFRQDQQVLREIRGITSVFSTVASLEEQVEAVQLVVSTVISFGLIRVIEEVEEAVVFDLPVRHLHRDWSYMVQGHFVNLQYRQCWPSQ